MKFTLGWLKDHLDTKASVTTSMTALIQCGLEVESIENPAEKLKDFTVARVIEARSIPMPTSCASARSRPARAWCRWSAARPMPGRA